MVLTCARCGAPYPTHFAGEWFSTRVQCADCHLAMDPTLAMLAPGRPDDEVDYDLAASPVGERTVVTSALLEQDLPYRWEQNFILVVHSSAEATVDGLLDELEGADWGDLRAGPGSEGLDSEGFADDGLDGVLDDEGEEAHAAMAEMFVVADRLVHRPEDTVAADDLAEASAVVDASPPPFGIEPEVWRRARSLAADLRAGVGGLHASGDYDGVVHTAQVLRDFLRPYV